MVCICRPSQAVQGAAAQLRVDEAAYSRQLHAAFAELVRERCVERCKPCELPRVAPRVSNIPNRLSVMKWCSSTCFCSWRIGLS